MTFPGSPRVLKGGIALLDPQSGAVRRVIPLQYNPDTLSRTLQVQGVGESAERSQALRLKGPPIETIKVEAEIDAADQLELPREGENSVTARFGLHPRLAELETIVYPTSAQLLANRGLADAGSLEIAPAETPLTLFIWSKSRVVPVRITDFSVTEEAFDPELNPIRARVSLGMRVLSVNDLGFAHRGGSLFLAYQRNKERLATLATGGALEAFGISAIP